MKHTTQPDNDQDDQPAGPTCPACGSPAAVPLGTLGALDWYRCQDCGMDYSSPAGVVGDGSNEVFEEDSWHAGLCGACGQDELDAHAYSDGATEYVCANCGAHYMEHPTEES